MIIRESYLLNFYTLILLLIILFTMILKKETYRYSSRMLKTVIILISIQMVVEIFSWSFDGINEPYARILNYTFNLLFFLMGSIIVGSFFSYIDYLIFKSKKRIKRRFFYMHLFPIFLIFTIINFFEPVIFRLTEVNIYQREPLMNVAFILVFAFLGYILVTAWIHRKKVDKTFFTSILIMAILPLIGGLLQMLFYGLLVMWAFVGLSVVIAYIYTESYSNSKDYLTKLYTREIAEDFMRTILESKDDAMVIMFDIDNLKAINDSHGHNKGDQVLFSFANALSSSFPEDAMISRYGGDEFIVVIKNIHENQLEIYLNALEKEMNHHIIDDSKIEYSYGTASSRHSENDNIKSLLHACDLAMYKQKELHKKS